MNKKKVLILICIVAGIIIMLFNMLFMFGSKPLKRDLYTVVIYNDTNETIKNMVVNVQDISLNSFVYSNEINIVPGEYRKVNINIYDPRLKNLSGSYNVFIDCMINEQELINTSAGYFTSEYGGLEVLILSILDSDYTRIVKCSDTDYLYKKIKSRHIKNPNEYSWK
ncbi:MAG: hypothetical protein IJ300_03545 [Clostridia bacterium]|nr:hypothetical protein [Clostridia bacterium]